MSSEIEVVKVPDEIKIEGMAIKPVRGITEEGKTIYEDNLQLELRNIGKLPFSFIDCTISYRNNIGKFIGSDSDGTFDELNPNDTCIISIPFFVPVLTVKKELKITIQHKESSLSKFFLWFIAGSIIFGIAGSILK